MFETELETKIDKLVIENGLIKQELTNLKDHHKQQLQYYEHILNENSDRYSNEIVYFSVIVGVLLVFFALIGYVFIATYKKKEIASIVDKAKDDFDIYYNELRKKDPRIIRGMVLNDFKEEESELNKELSKQIEEKVKYYVDSERDDILEEIYSGKKRSKNRKKHEGDFYV